MKQLRSLTVEPGDLGNQWMKLTLGVGHQEAFERLTTDALDHQIAIVRGDEVISAPTVREPIADGAVLVTMPVDRGHFGSDALARELLGGAASPADLASSQEDSIDGLRWMWDRWHDPS